MRQSVHFGPALVVPAVALLAGVLAYPFLPLQVPIHAGSACTSRVSAAIEIPLLLCAIGAVVDLLRRTHPRLQLARLLAVTVILVTGIYALFVIAYLGACP